MFSLEEDPMKEGIHINRLITKQEDVHSFNKYGQLNVDTSNPCNDRGLIFVENVVVSSIYLVQPLHQRHNSAKVRYQYLSLQPCTKWEPCGNAVNSSNIPMEL